MDVKRYRYASDSDFGGDQWEDLSEPEQLATPPASDSRCRSPTATPRRRRLKRKVHPSRKPAENLNAVGSVNAAPVEPEKSNSRTHEPIITREQMEENLVKGLKFIVNYCLDVMRRTIILLKYPLILLVFLWFIALLLARFSVLLHATFSPLCSVPGISSLAFCRPIEPVGQGNRVIRADYPALAKVQMTFDQLLEEGLGGAGLSIQIKKAEMATADLVTVVRVSKLRSRETIADSLAEFVRDARKTGRGLQKLNSKIGGAVDGIMAVNDYALQTIEEAAAKRASWSPFMLLLPWGASAPDTNEVIVTTFTDAMNTLSNSMNKLILEAEVSLKDLNALEEKLNTLKESVVRENSALSENKEELLAKLWTTFGGNRRALRGIDNNLALLENMENYHQRARAHVVAALHALERINADMEDLRERVAAPELTAGQIPVEVHIKSIKSGLERLKEGRLRAKEEEEQVFRRVMAS